jgi:hypothetical protein
MKHNTIIHEYVGKDEMLVKVLKNAVGKHEVPEDRPPIPKDPRKKRIEPMTDEEKQGSMKRSRSRARVKVSHMLKSNEWDEFVTLTFSPESVDRYDYDACLKLFQTTMRNVKHRKAEALEYLFVVEQHKDGALHLHGLLKGTQGLTFSDTKNKDNAGRTIRNWTDWKQGFSTVTKVGSSSKAESYLSKYVTKQDNIPIGRKRYLASRGIDRTVTTRLFLTDRQKILAMQKLIETHETASSKTVIVQGGKYSQVIHYLNLRQS